MAAELSVIERLLAYRIGLDPVSVGSALILRAAQQRMKELGLADINAYERRVRQSESELQELIEAVVVSESWFFRDERPFQWFGEYVRTHWLGDGLRMPLRVLSMACAGGEEPYSIAITLRDLGVPIDRFEIDAVDISARRLAIARRGVYSANAFRSLDLGFRTRYFRESPQGYELDSSIRSTVHFIQANVLDPHLLEGSPRYDVIFCRNILIYLGVSARVCVLAAVERLLKDDGLLFIGHADRLDIPGMEPKFTAIGDPACFVCRLSSRGPMSPACHEFRSPSPNSGLVGPDGASCDPNRVPRFGSIPTSDNTQLDPIGDATISSGQGDGAPVLDHAAELANQGRFDDAIAVCERHLRIKGYSPPAFYLLGMICQAAGNRQRAEDCFQKTLYLDPLHDEALLALALLAERRGDESAALGFRRRAERSLTKSRNRVN